MITSHSHRLSLNFGNRFSTLLFGLATLAFAGTPALCGPIHDAVRAGDLDKVKALVKESPDLVSSKDEKYGQTPLHVAAFNDRKDVAEFLLANKADVNAKAKNGSTPLHLAAAKGNKDIVELLLANKADIDAADNEGWSPVHSAVTFSQKDIAEFLIAKGGKDLPAPPAAPSAKTSAEKGPPVKTGSDGQFNLMDDGTVVDTKNNLMWMGRDNGAAMSWPDATKYVTDYHGAGYSDWRLPTLAEVSALYNKDKSRKTFCAAAVDEMGAPADVVHLPDVFHLTCARVWTSKETSEKPVSATVFDFHFGKDTTRPEAKDFVDTGSRVLVVREMKPPAAASSTQPNLTNGTPISSTSK